MLFAKTGSFYPYDMLFINYAAFFAALILMWIKAPFSTALKIIITFSYISVTYFAVTARCYSIGILGLFIMAVLYKNQLKRPVLFSIAAGLTANTSAIAAIGASGLILPFLYNLIKNRKETGAKSIIISFFILAASFIFLIIPHTHLTYDVTADWSVFCKRVIFDFFQNNIYFTISYFFVFLCLLIFYEHPDNAWLYVYKLK